MKIKNGKVVANGTINEFKTIKAIQIDLKTKWAGVSCGSVGQVPFVSLSPNESSIHLDKKAESDYTFISFPEYSGWDILIAEVRKYSLYVVFTRDTFVG